MGVTFVKKIEKKIDKPVRNLAKETREFPWKREK